MPILLGLMKTLVGALAGAFTGWLKEKRHEDQLKTLGALEAKAEAADVNRKVRGQVISIEDRLRTDPDYAERMRARFDPDRPGD